MRHLEEEGRGQAVLLEQYEERFIRLREIVENKERESNRRVQELEMISQDLQIKSQKQATVIQQLEEERSHT